MSHLTEKDEVTNRRSEYYEDLLNVDEGGETELTEVNLNEVNDRLLFEICVDVSTAVKRLKDEKHQAAGGITSEMSQYGGECKVFMFCLAEERVPKDKINHPSDA